MTGKSQLPIEETAYVQLVLISGNLQSDPNKVCTGVIFPKETQLVRLEQDQSILTINFSVEVAADSEQLLDISKVAAFFPIQSPTNTDYLMFQKEGSVWVTSTTFQVSTADLPTAYRFTIRVQYIVNTQPVEYRVENVDPMVVVGEVDTDPGGNGKKGKHRTLSIHLK